MFAELSQKKLLAKRRIKSDWQIEATKLNFQNLSNHQVDDIVYRIAVLRCGQAIQFYSCFISYSTKDQEFAKRLHEDLQNKRVRCWFASEDLKIGDPFRQRIDEAIRLHEKLLVLVGALRRERLGP
jgi:hypothetical protein